VGDFPSWRPFNSGALVLMPRNRGACRSDLDDSAGGGGDDASRV